MKNILRTVAVVTVFGLLLSIAKPVQGGSNNPNPQASQLCPFGPGIARWSVKTSVPQGALTQSPTSLELDKFIYAPNLLVSKQTVAAAHLEYAKVAPAMAQGVDYLAMPLPSEMQPFVATLKWARPARPFEVSLPAISPPLIARARSYAVGQANSESAPSPFFALLTAQLNDSRINEPVEIGNAMLREGETISVTGTVVASTCEHDDGDFHIDLGSKSGCAVVEVPNPYYIRDPALREEIARAETIAKNLQSGERITVTGQLFYDTVHQNQGDPGGRRGKGFCARSLWEVHPIFAINPG